MNGNPCARAGGAFAYVMGNYRAVERKRLDAMQADLNDVARGLLPARRSRRDYCGSCGYTDSHDPNCPRPK